MADKMATRQAYGKTLVELGEKYENLVVIDGDLSQSTKTVEFKKVDPERFFNMGIAEQNIYGVAAGMAHSGKIVCASTFAMFATGRAFEIVRNSIGYTRANVKICATHAGITVGEDGASHQTFEDIALMRTVPGMIILNPSDGVSARKLLIKAIEINGPVYVRLGRAEVPIVYSDEDSLEVGKSNTIFDGKDATIIATGIMLNEGIIARKELAKAGLDVAVMDMHTIKPIDEEAIIAAAKKTGSIVTAEEHSIIGGLGSAVAEVLSKNCPIKMAMVGQNDCYGESGKPEELKAKYGMNAEAIINAVKGLV
ncbi:MAG: transketolase family protein [Anaerovoracaceae bacterium]